MSWRIFLSDSSRRDHDALTPADRAAIIDELFAWARRTGRLARDARSWPGAQLFEDQLPSGINVTYFVEEQVPHVGIVVFRRR